MVEPWGMEEGSEEAQSCPATIQIMQIEIGHVELRYAHTRFYRPEAVASLAASLERSYQISPVVTIKEGDLGFVLIDGYLRVAALKLCKRDRVLAEVWPCQEWEALLRVLMRSGERRWEALEQGLLIRELQQRGNLSQSKIAHLLGRDKSWVNRRLGLFSTLPEEILEMVRRGQVSLWAASRVLTPLSRANPEHARALANGLVKEGMSTRELMKLFDHYRKANRKQRENMVLQPLLFLRALKAMEDDKQARSIREGPEGVWLRDMKALGGILSRLQRDLPNVIYQGQGNLQRRRLLTAFEDARRMFAALDKEIREIVDEGYRGDQASCLEPAPPGDQTQRDQPTAQALQEYDPGSDPGTYPAGAQERVSLP